MNPLDDFNFGNNEERVSKKQLIAGVSIIAVLIFLSGGFLLWQKKFQYVQWGKDGGEDKITLINYAKDSDSDGLKDVDEELYGTNLFEADTDGDGHSDFEEINAGYNPLGEGRLSLEQSELIKKTSYEVTDEMEKSINKEFASNLYDSYCGAAFNPDQDILEMDGQDFCYSAKALSSGQISYCKKIKDRDNRDNCYDEVARNESRGKYCSEISDALTRESCYYDMSLKAGDESLCAKLPDDESGFSQANCISKVAESKKDYQICERIANNHYNMINGRKDYLWNDRKYNCYIGVVKITGDIKVCEALLLDFMDYNNQQADIYGNFTYPKWQLPEYQFCLAEVAGVTGDISLCSKIDYKSGVSGDYQYFGIDRCYEAVGIHNRDIKTCNLIKLNKDKCLEAAAGVSSDPTICEKIINLYEKSECYRKIALNSDNASLCKKMSLEHQQDECIKAVAAKTGEISTCKTFIKQEDVDNCIYGIAKAVNNKGVCSQIELKHIHGYCLDIFVNYSTDPNFCLGYKWENKKDGCYETIAKNKKDPDVCPMIGFPDKEYYCIISFIKSKEDAYLCEKISDESYRKKCEAKIRLMSL